MFNYTNKWYIIVNMFCYINRTETTIIINKDNIMQEEATKQFEELQEKLKEYKLRIFDMAEQYEELNKAFQGSQKQTQEFVTAVMTVVGMEMTEQVLLSDVVDKVKESVTVVEEVEEVEE